MINEHQLFIKKYEGTLVVKFLRFLLLRRRNDNVIIIKMKSKMNLSVISSEARNLFKIAG